MRCGQLHVGSGFGLNLLDKIQQAGKCGTVTLFVSLNILQYSLDLSVVLLCLTFGD